MYSPLAPQKLLSAIDKEVQNPVSILVAGGTLSATAIWRDVRRSSAPRRWEANLIGAVP